MRPSRRALIVGGSLGGLCAANLLHRAGWDVEVYERAAGELQGRGAGVVTHPELLTALSAAGIVVDDSVGVRVDKRVTLARDGSTVGTRDLPQTLTSWARLYELLHDALPVDRYHGDKKLVDFAQDDDHVSVEFADGTVESGDVLIGADGLRSTIRQMLLPAVRPMYAGYIAWRGLVDESRLSRRALDELFPFFAFGIPPREQMIAYPVAGADNAVAVGQRRYNFVWYRPADASTVLKDMLTDDTGKTWHDGIPPPLIRAPVLAEAKQAADDVLAPQFAELVAKTASLFFQPIFDLESTRLVFGRVALLGDAAFVARPHCGMGVTKAAADAVALVDALERSPDVSTALAAYERTRLGPGRQVVHHARALGAYMQAQLSTPQEREMAERYRTADVIMRETAVPFVAKADQAH